MKCLVTGAAGFIGSQITERLLDEGFEVVGVDCFTPYYDRELKKKNLFRALASKKFRLVAQDLLKTNLKKLFDGTDYVFHEAAQPGVLSSWGKNFSAYIKDNVEATQRLLEAAKDSKIKKFVYASSSSVYGDSPLPMKESNPTKPYSPYGVTKLAAENLAYLYCKNYGVPVVSLRYFTVFGPRQRPDMAFNKFIRAMFLGQTLTLYGDGKQSRDVTFVSDVVEANLLAMKSKTVGEVFNIGGGNRTTVNHVIALLEQYTGKKAKIKGIAKQKGDVVHTEAHTQKSTVVLGFQPRVKLEQGLKEQVEWMRRIVKK